MKRKFGLRLMAVGAMLISAAVVLLIFNTRQDEVAGSTASAQLEVLVEQISHQETFPEATESNIILQILPDEVISEVDKSMHEIILDGYAYIGYLSIPALNLDLPVMSDWSESQLQKAPCRYTGTLLGNDLVIMAHNYGKHFGTIGKLQPGDAVIFTDVDGKTTSYEVVLQEILQPTEVDAMVSGVFDMTLFTCTYGGQTRITVRCNRAD